MYVTYNSSKLCLELKSLINRSTLEESRSFIESYLSYVSSNIVDDPQVCLWYLHNLSLDHFRIYSTSHLSLCCSSIKKMLLSHTISPIQLSFAVGLKSLLCFVSKLNIQSPAFQILEEIQSILSVFTYKVSLFFEKVSFIDIFSLFRSPVALSLGISDTDISAYLGVHIVGSSGFFSEVEQFVASLLISGLTASDFRFVLNNSPYQSSSYFKAIQDKFFVSPSELSSVAINPVRSLALNALRDFANVHSLLGSEVLAENKRKIYRTFILPALIEKFFSRRDRMAQRQEIIFTNSHSGIASFANSYLALFLRLGDKVLNESRAFSMSDVAKSFFSNLQNFSGNLPSRIVVFSDSKRAVESFACLTCFEVVAVSPPSGCGYRHSDFLSLSDFERLAQEDVIVANYLSLSSSSLLCGDASSNIVNASYASLSGHYIDLPIWGSTPKILF